MIKIDDIKLKMECLNIVSRYLIEEVGLNIRPNFEIISQNEEFIISLNCCIPIAFIEEPIIIENIGIIKLDKNKKIIYANTNEEIDKNIAKKILEQLNNNKNKGIAEAKKIISMGNGNMGNESYLEASRIELGIAKESNEKFKELSYFHLYFAFWSAYQIEDFNLCVEIFKIMDRIEKLTEIQSKEIRRIEEMIKEVK